MLFDLPPKLRSGQDAPASPPPLHTRSASDRTDLRAILESVEDRMIAEALVRTGGNKNRAAELLGLNRTTLVEKLRRKRSAMPPRRRSGQACRRIRAARRAGRGWRPAGRESVGVSEFVGVLREDEERVAGRSRSQAAHADRHSLVATATATAHAGRPLW